MDHSPTPPIAARSSCPANSPAAAASSGERHTAAVQSPAATLSAGQYEISPQPSGSVPVSADRRCECSVSVSRSSRGNRSSAMIRVGGCEPSQRRNTKTLSFISEPCDRFPSRVAKFVKTVCRCRRDASQRRSASPEALVARIVGEIMARTAPASLVRHLSPSVANTG